MYKTAQKCAKLRKKAMNAKMQKNAECITPPAFGQRRNHFAAREVGDCGWTDPQK